ncbi:MAG: OsmC family protein [Cellvibrionaceae bacterium]|nr:OsmC family protein [Cellvibrionaceae bacterium]MCV6625308.1 OsmC family protein [Cellvibrionaceae bacterium]
MKANVKWSGQVAFMGETGSGHKVQMDGPADKGGKDLGARPMELMLLAVGGCSSFDVIGILQKARQDIVDCEVSVEGERVDDVPAVYSKIHLHFTVSGRGLKQSQVKRAVALSADKYCSASIMLARGGVELSHSYEIKEVP